MKKIYLLFVFLISIFFGIFIISFSFSREIVVENHQNYSVEDLSLLFKDNFDQKKNPAFYLKTISDLRNDFILEEKNFLEVNLEKMRVRLYENGKITKDSPILLKGDSQNWEGSAAGIYKIISKNKINFSIISNVYLPYALHYYGKYYLHGEPYYINGIKRISDVTGGCIQLSDKNAKEIYEAIEPNFPLIVIDKEKDDYKYQENEPTKITEVSAKSYLVADLDSGFVFAEKDIEEKLPIASLTKLMTAIILNENVDLRKKITIKKEMLNAFGNSYIVEEGKIFNVVQLFYPLLIESSNDAGEALSYFLGREKTIKLMNEKAKTILMEKTDFFDPHGYDPKNVSTAKDLFQLARYLLNNRTTILEITKSKKVYSFGDLGFEPEYLYNKNIFFENENFIGGKTGIIKGLTQSALFIFKFTTQNKENRNIAIILLNSNDLEQDSQKISQWLKENYFNLE